MNFGLKLAAIAAIVSSTSFANAETVAPDDVKLTDGVIAASLTGEEGDPEEGALIFASKKLGNCLACHANTAMKDQLGEAFKPAVPLFDIEDGLSEHLVISNGDMHRIEAAIAHLAEYLLRPIGVLQTVDAKAHFGVPAAM